MGAEVRRSAAESPTTAVSRAGGWDEEADVVVVGFGAAGATAALEAAETGASVLVLDRWGNGGASARSAGIVYAGGGTPQQRAAGFEDDADAMLRYLRGECDGAVDDDVLADFCAQSASNLAWLESHGVRFAEGFESRKVITPTDDDIGLYFSGNERQRPNAHGPVPRGHRVAGVGLTGADLHAGLAATVAARGIEVRAGARLVRLVEEERRVVGIDVLCLPASAVVRAGHQLLGYAASAAALTFHRVPGFVVRMIDAYERRYGRIVRIRARRGVVLATGGFSFNRVMRDAEAPGYRGAIPLGTVGDDGSGIESARELGAATRHMESCGASRFLSPSAFSLGVMVDGTGERICDETLYAATLSKEIAGRGGRAWLIVDADAIERIKAEVRDSPRVRDQSLYALVSGRALSNLFPRVFGLLNLHVNGRSAASLDDLAVRLGIPAAALEQTIGRYNADARAGRTDAMGKMASMVSPLDRAPFRAIPVHLDSFVFPAPCITLGGLHVDHATQMVLREDGSTIEGLHAAGRCAAGIPSRSYVSGLSLADCVFSGRKAGAAAADARAATIAKSGP